MPINIRNLDGTSNKLPFSGVNVPACKSCNQERSKQDSIDKFAIKRVREGQINLEDAQTLLNFLDRVRIGYWRFLLSKNKKNHAIEPRFAINQRTGAHDRIAIIQRLKNSKAKGLALVGTNVRAFFNQPSVFGIIFKDLAMISFSGAYAMYDFFGMTEFVPSEEGIARRFRGFTTLDRALGDLSLIGGLKLFEFREYFSGQPVQALNEKTWYSHNAITSFFEDETKLEVPRTNYGPEVFAPLFDLNVTELQMAALYTFPNERFEGRNSNQVLRNKAELERISQIHLNEVNRNSLLARSKPRIIVPNWS